MQVTEVSAEGLKHEYRVVVAAGDIAQKVQERLQRIGKTVKVPGFRPGKVPLSLLKRQYGRSVMGEILEEAVDEGSRQAINDSNLRPALRPKIEVTSFDEGKDLEFSMQVEVLPEVPAIDLATVKLTKQVAPVDEADVDRALTSFATSSKEFHPLAEPRPSRDGDQLTLDFKGSVDGTPFEGGEGSDFKLVLGSNSMIPGFEDGLLGTEAGQEVEVKATFPSAYPREDLAGKEASFAVSVKAVEEADAVAIDDDLAKKLGLDDLAALRSAMRDRFAGQHEQASRAKLKRALLDHLAEAVQFTVPAGMVELELETIWKQLTEEMERSKSSFADMGKTEDEVKAEYRGIAERRVRLGLVLSDIGTKNEVKVEQKELQAAVIAQARRYQGQERQVIEFFQKNPEAIEQLRAPIFEDKVCDFIFAGASVTEATVTAEELLRDIDDDAEAGDATDAAVEPVAEKG